MVYPKTLEFDSREYKNMMAVAKMLEAVSPNGYCYNVETCYFDYGQDWWQTTILCHDYSEKAIMPSWQAINPREWGEIVQAETVTELADIVEEIRAGKYFSDK